MVVFIAVNILSLPAKFYVGQYDGNISCAHILYVMIFVTHNPCL